MEADLPVREIMTRDVVVGEEDDTLYNATIKMMEKNVGSIVVIKGEVPVGIVTERDILEKVVAKNLRSKDVKLGDIMSSPVITISPTKSVREAAREMVKRGIRRLPVVENNKLVGIITDTDLLSVSLDLNEVLMALIRVEPESTGEITQGMCDKCGELTEELFEMEGLLLCESCLENSR